MKSVSLSKYELILLPGFVQWDTAGLEKQFAIEIRKGPEFASDIPMILKNLDKICQVDQTKIPITQEEWRESLSVLIS